MFSYSTTPFATSTLTPKNREAASEHHNRVSSCVTIHNNLIYGSYIMGVSIGGYDRVYMTHRDATTGSPAYGSNSNQRFRFRNQIPGNNRIWFPWTSLESSANSVFTFFPWTTQLSCVDAQ